MRNSIRSTRNRLAALAAAGVLTVGSGLAAVAFTAGSASAAPCANAGAGALAAGCSVAGTVTFSAGLLDLNAPATMAWGGTITGDDQQVADTVGVGDINQFEVLDATGTGAGWTVTAAASTFTGTATDTLPDAAALSFDASATIPDDTTDTLDAACAVTSPTCVVPTSDVAYPVPITTDALGTDLAYNITDAAVGTGIGDILLGQTAPPTFWLTIPGNALADTYTTTITLSVSSAPDGGLV